MRDANPNDIKSVIHLLLDKLKDEDTWTKITAVLEDCAPEKSGERIQSMEYIACSELPRAFDVLYAHLKRCQENKFTADELESAYNNISKLYDYRIIPIMIEQYRKTRHTKYIDCAQRAEFFSSTPNRFEWTPKITSTTLSEDIEKAIKELETYYNFRSKQIQPANNEIGPPQRPNMPSGPGEFPPGRPFPPGKRPLPPMPR